MNVGQRHNIKMGNKSFEPVEQFRYLETNLIHQNCIHKQINSKLNWENVCCSFGAESFALQFAIQNHRD
jgi:hypothetical protein